MLSINAMRKDAGDYYLNLAREDYYLKGGEPPGRWFGEGARLLQLDGRVNRAEFERLLSGYHPHRNYKLVFNAGQKQHRPGWDLTFSAPKSVSVWWSQADQSLRSKIQQAHAAAVEATLGYIEQEQTWTRFRTADKQLEFSRAGLAAATFEHSTNRNLDPHLHTHALLFNVGMQPDITSSALYSPAIYRAKMAAGALYRIELAHQLGQHFDLRFSRDGRSFRIDGVSPALEKRFSSRRQEILARLDSMDTHHPKVAEKVALDSRQSKTVISRPHLFQNWRAAGRALGWDQQDAKALANSNSRDASRAQPDYQTAFNRALEEATRSQSTFSATDLLKYAAYELQANPAVNANDLRKQRDRFLSHSREVVPLARENGRTFYTTREILELEKQLVATAEGLARRSAMAPSESTIAHILQNRVPLNDEQEKALRHLLEPSRLGLVSGLPGTGKTYLLRAATQAWEEAGYSVRGAALAGKAALGLETSAGITSQTIYSLLKDADENRLDLNSKTVLVVDEAGMVGTRQMARLFDLVEDKGAKLVLIGDENQLQPIDAGGPLKSLLMRHHHARLDNIQRQTECWARDAVKQAVIGNADGVLQAFEQRGFLRITDEPEQAATELLKLWRERLQEDPAKNLILAMENLAVDHLNRQAQQIRHAGDQLGEIGINVRGSQFHQNDRLVFTRNDRRLKVKNGHLGTVTGIDANQRLVHVRLDHGSQVTVPVDEYDHLKLGYAVTDYKAQGVTVENNVFVLMQGHMEDRQHAVVQLSRSKQNTWIVTDQQTAGEAKQDLVRMLSRNRQKSLVIDQFPQILTQSLNPSMEVSS